VAQWDVFHSDRLELVRGLSAEEIRSGLASGEIRDDDLVRPSGTAVAWARIAEFPELLEPPAETPTPAPAETPPAEPIEDRISFPVIPPEPPAVAPAPAWPWDDDYEDSDEDEDEDEGEGEGVSEFEERDASPPTLAPADPIVPSWELTDDDLNFDRPPASAPTPAPVSASAPISSSSHVALPVVPSRDWHSGAVGVEEEDDDEPIISLSRSGPPRVEELDLAAMVDVAFQLVLFFLVTATTILYKTLEIPKPSEEAPPSAVAQGRSRSLDDLKEDYILVEIDAEGNVKLDREPVAAQMESLAEQLRVAREKSGRKTMLLSADFTTPHRSAVLAYDAANEIGLGIAIAKPTPPQGPAPALKPAQPAAKPAPPS
jgi:biopolymer transport protein ExbD